MNLWARLCGEAKPGQILVDRKVKASAGTQFRAIATRGPIPAEQGYEPTWPARAIIIGP